MSHLQKIDGLADRIRDVVKRLAEKRGAVNSHSLALTHLIGNYVMVINFVLDEMNRDRSTNEQSTARLSQMVERMRDASNRLVQQSLGRPLTHCLQLSAREVAEQSVSQISAYTAWKGSTIVVEHPTQDLNLWADMRAAQECLMTLLENAVKYSPPSSVVRLTYQAEHDFVTFQVQDSGPGVAPEERDHLFEPGFVGQICATAEEPRFGAGLSVAKALAEDMGGGVGHLLEHPSPGACFVLRLKRVPGGVA